MKLQHNKSIAEANNKIKENKKEVNKIEENKMKENREKKNEIIIIIMTPTSFSFFTSLFSYNSLR